MNTKTALITGASGGIGAEFARIFAQNKINVIVVARSEDKLQLLCEQLTANFGIQAHYFCVDLTQSGAAQKLKSYTDQLQLPIDYLVNNAGYGVYGEFIQTDLAQNLNMISLNVNTLVSLCHIYGASMTTNGFGKILNVASTAAFMPGPFMSVYFASKAFVLSFSNAIHAELKNKGVTVSTLCPGPTATGFEKTAEGMNNSSLFENQKVATPHEVAQDGFNALMHNEPLKISGVLNSLSVFMLRLLPRQLIVAITKKLTQPKN